MTSNLRPKADKRKKATAVAAPPVAEISRADIARKAYELYCARGGRNGSELDDWLRAERELLSAAVLEPPRRSARKAAN